MAAEITPEEIRRAEFRTTLRGLDSGEVNAFLDRVATEVGRLAEDRDRLAQRLGEFADKDLAVEFESVGREVTAVLQAAREAAESMRQRASADAARWRSEAMAEVEAMRKDARNDAEALRGDAWTTGTEMLNQAAAEARRIRAQAERDVLTVMGEAEREAHRLVSSARRDAEDLVRAARMEAEKTASEAKKQHDEMIRLAMRQAESAQERTRALEQRREELIAELETVRKTLSQLEGALEERREALDLPSESTSVRVVPAPRQDPDPNNWELGETVRVIPPAGRHPSQAGARLDEPPPAPAVEAEPEPEAVAEEETKAETKEEPAPRLPRQPEVPRTRPEEESSPEPAEEPEPEEELEPEGEPEPEDEEPSPSESGPDEVSVLFASLRGAPPPEVTAEPEPLTEHRPERDTRAEESTPAPSPPTIADRADLIDARDGRLLPITNRALRGVKKAVTDVQNLALDRLRTEGEWQPEVGPLTEMLRADLIALWAESFSAGHAAAEEMTGARLKRGDTPPAPGAGAFATDLAEAVARALSEAGEGPRERQAAASRVFRGWRTDEAERRVRELALRGYHRGLVDAAAGRPLEWVANGTPCSACRQAAADPAAHLPPVHSGCECTIGIG